MPQVDRSRHEGRHVVAVYGTLKRGEVNYRLLERGGAEAAGEGTVAGVLYDLGWYPGLRDEPGRVEVELYAVDDELLRVLHRLEAYDPEDEAGSAYVRRPAEVHRTDGSRAEAWDLLVPRSNGAGPAG